MDALNIAAWQDANPHAFIALELTLPDETVRLTSGGTVVLGGQTYLPEHDDLGVLSSVANIEEGQVSEAIAPDLTFEPYTDDGVAALTAPAAQGSPWVLYWGQINPNTGAVIGTPVTLTTGLLNVASLAVSTGRRSVVLTSYTFEQFQLTPRGVRLAETPAIKPLMSSVTRKIYWRAEQPRGAIRYGTGGGGYTGGGNEVGGGPGNRIG